MEVRSPRDDERGYIRETALKVLKPAGVRWREWEALRGPEIADLDADVAVEDGMIAGFCLRARQGGPIRLLYVRKNARGYGIGRILWERAWGNPATATGIGPWSDLGVSRRTL